jgi:HD superfamily phosphodiesterase
MIRIKKQTIIELGKILKEEFNYNLSGQDLETLANSLVGYFDLLIKVNQRSMVRKSSTQRH